MSLAVDDDRLTSTSEPSQGPPHSSVVAGLVDWARHALRDSAKELTVLGLLKLAVSLLVVAGGFVAISDDDFARVVIAQEFAHSPSLDPSGTSWLPIPFWIQGLPMLLFGRSFEVARVVAIASGIVAVWWVYAAARLLGCSRAAAFAGGGLAAAFPYSAWLGVATVPELLTASAVVLGVATLVPRQDAIDSVTLRIVGAGLLTLAAGSRYEAWPVALGFAFLSAWDARRLKRRGLWVAAGMAASFPVAWLLHGLVRHDDLFFFVHRVADYKAALGGAAADWTSVADYPLAVLRHEPELVGATVLGLLLLRPSLPWRRPVLLIALQIAFLIVGELRGGAPTHHSERAVLSVWLLSSIALGHLALVAWRERRLVLFGAWALIVVVSVSCLRPWYARRDGFADRSAELSLGRDARSRSRSNHGLVVATPDFGYFAVIAGFGAPELCRVLEKHDPRQPETRPLSPETVLEAAREVDATQAVLSTGHLATAWGASGGGASRLELVPLPQVAGNSPVSRPLP